MLMISSNLTNSLSNKEGMYVTEAIVKAQIILRILFAKVVLSRVIIKIYATRIGRVINATRFWERRTRDSETAEVLIQKMLPPFDSLAKQKKVSGRNVYAKSSEMEPRTYISCNL